MISRTICVKKIKWLYEKFLKNSGSNHLYKDEILNIIEYDTNLDESVCMYLIYIIEDYKDVEKYHQLGRYSQLKNIWMNRWNNVAIRIIKRTTRNHPERIGFYEQYFNLSLQTANKEILAYIYENGYFQYVCEAFTPLKI